jgi:hypothetical protein
MQATQGQVQWGALLPAMHNSSSAVYVRRHDYFIASFKLASRFQVRQYIKRRNTEATKLTYSRHEALREGLLQLQSSVDQLLRRMRESSQHDQADDTELDALLLQTTKRIDAYRVAVSPKDSPQLQANNVPDPQLLTWDLRTMSPSFTPGELLVPNPTTPEYTDPFPFTKNQAFELIEYFRFEVECFYPFIPFESMTSLAGAVTDPPTGAPAFITDTGSEDWCDMTDSRNLDMLRIILACALAAKSKKETETSCRLISIVSDKLTMKLNGPELDTKDIAVATLLVSASPTPSCRFIFRLM